MTPIEREELKRRAEAKLAAMRERARRLRGRVLSGAAIGFAVIWVAIFTQMISGHDPVLGPATATVRGATKDGAAQPETRVAAEDHSAGDDDDHGGDDDDQDEEGGWIAPVEKVVAPVEELIEGPSEEAEELEPATTGQS